MRTQILTRPAVDKTSLLAAGATVIFWASAFAGIRVGLQSYSPESLALLRYLVASFALLIYALVTRMPLLPELRDVPGIAALGFLGLSVYNVALNAGEVGISAGSASFIIASAPIWMAVGATLFLGERLNPWGWGGIALSFTGVAIISLSSGDRFSLDPRVLLVLLAALVQASYSVGQKSFLKKYGALRFIAYAVWAGTAFLLVFLPRLMNELQTAASESTLAVAYMGLVPGVLAYASWSFVLSRIPASVAGSFLYFVPVFATLIAWFWLGEVPPVMAVLGGGFIVAGVVTVSTRGRQLRRI